MPAILNKFLLLTALFFLAGGAAFHDFASSASAAPKKTAVKKARWVQPAKKPKPSVKAKSKSKSNSKTKSKKASAKKAPPKKKSSATAKSKPAQKPVAAPKKTAPVKATPKKNDVAKTPKKKDPPKELTVAQSITDEDIDNLEERGTSPWLYVFIAFVLACIGGMFFLNSRRRQLEAARVNFRDYTSNHEVAFNSKNSEMDMPAQSGHEAPTTSTLFARTNDIRQSDRSRRDSFLEKISNKASGLLKTSTKGRTKTRDAVRGPTTDAGNTASSFEYDDEDTSFASITTISAVRSSSGRADTRSPVNDSVAGTAEPLVANVQGEPCSFERYVEIQVAIQCWRAKEIPINQKLQDNFGINTEELIQYEFYWKQKISGNINLRKKFEELEPLYSAKYEAA